MKNKKLLGVLGVAALLLAGNFAWQKNEVVDAAAPTTLYLSPGAWTSDGARFAAYFFGNGEKWVSMTDTDKDGVYEVATPTGYPSVIFCRMNPSTTTNNWNNKWNQSADLTIPNDGKNRWTFGGNWDTGAGTWDAYTPASNPEPQNNIHAEVNQLVTKYYNHGVYVKETDIYLTDSAVKELLALDNGFHNDVSDLERTTYFYHNELWMTNNAGVNSGYGTDKNGNMTHFSYVDGVQKVDYTVQKQESWTEDGMEGYYLTVKDIVATAEHEWEKDGSGVYSSSNTDLFELFKAITAPCYKGFKAEMTNYINFDHVEVAETSNGLELSLYASGSNGGALTTTDSDENTPDLFSKAVITKGGIKVQVGSQVLDVEINENPSDSYILTEYFVTGVDVKANDEFKVLKYGIEPVTITNYTGILAAGKFTEANDACDVYIKYYEGAIDVWASEQTVAVEDDLTIYFNNTKGWTKVNIYYWGGEAASWPGVAMEKVGTTNYYKYTLPEGTTHIIFNNGSSQTVDINLADLGENNAYTLSTQTGGKYNVTTSKYTEE